MLWTVTVPNKTSRMIIGPGGKFKKAVMKETGVDVDVVPLSDVQGYLWTITGEDANVKLSLEYLNAIYENTILKVGKSREPSPFLEQKLGRSQELIKEKEEMMQILAKEKLIVERISIERDNAKRDAMEKETKLLYLNRSIKDVKVKEFLLRRRERVIKSKEQELATTKLEKYSLESELFSVKQELEDMVKELKKKDEEIILLKQLEACDETNDKLTKAIESMEEADKQYKKVETDVATLTRKVMLMEEGGKKAGVTLCNTVAKLSENADKIQKAVKVVENTCLNNEGTIKELEKNLGSTIKMAADNEHKLDELSRKLETGGEQLKKEVVVKVVQTLSILKSGNE